MYGVTIILQVIMSSSISSGIYDEHDPKELDSNNDGAGPAEEVFTFDSGSDPDEDPDFMSNDDDLDDFQPFALPDFGDDDIPSEDDVLALPLSYMTSLALDTPNVSILLCSYLFPAFPLAAIPMKIGRSSSS
ncbi:hypothetical protein Hanom_Chr10g00915481 [Helianthus anomalus]